MMNMLDRLYYTYYWMYRNDGESNWVAHFYVLFFLWFITVPYIGILWYLPLLLPNTLINSLGIEIPMYIGYFLVFAFLCIRFGWRKRYAHIISQHDKYNKEDYKRLRKRGIIVMCIGFLIFIIMLWIGLFINITKQQ